MSDLTVGEILSMTDEELVLDLVKSGDIPGCKVCETPIQESVTGCRTIKDENGVKREHCSDCFFSNEPFQNSVGSFLEDPKNRNSMSEDELFASYL